MDNISALKCDLAELECLFGKATRTNVKDFLNTEIRRLTVQIESIEPKKKCALDSCSSCPLCEPEIHKSPPSVENGLRSPPLETNRRYEIRLNNYAWDQTTKHVRFYVTLLNVHNLNKDCITVKFTDKSLEMRVNNLDSKNYVFCINNLLKPICTAECTFRVKPDMVIITAVKLEHCNWTHVTSMEKRVCDSKSAVPNMDKYKDPSEGLMSIMKSMYEQGDDDMKRTIAKAWCESQNKTSC